MAVVGVIDVVTGVIGSRCRLLAFLIVIVMLWAPRVAHAASVMEFSTGITAGSGPAGIVAGADGNLWFTEAVGNRIGRITPSGTVTEFASGITAASGPLGNLGGIVAGADGNLWFTEAVGNRIGRITPSGTVTEFASGITAGSSPAGIAAGPDGNLWFTELYGNRIGRITPSGAVTEFASGITAGSGPAGIAAGPDGNLWFTELYGNRIGRITPSGAVTEFASGITAASDPLGIAAGPDGSLWFTEYRGSRIGRITPDALPVPGLPPPTPPQTAASLQKRPGRSAAFTVSPKSLRVSSTGRFTYVFIATPLSSGKIRLSSINKVKVGSKRRTLMVAAKTFTAPANGKVKVRFTLSATNLKALKRVKRLRCTVTATVAGQPFTTRLVLKAPRAYPVRSGKRTR
jgi:streptogramin lyase